MKLNKIIMAIALVSTTVTQANSLQLQSSIANIIKQAGNQAKLGVILMSNQGKTLFQYHSNHTFIPASTAKLMTAAAALHVLGENFTYSTRLFTQAKTIQKKHIARQCLSAIIW